MELVNINHRCFFKLAANLVSLQTLSYFRLLLLSYSDGAYFCGIKMTDKVKSEVR